MKKNLLAAAIVAAAALFGNGAHAQTGTDPAPGMQMHVHGHQLYLSGDVGWLDGYALQNLLARLNAQGITIDTLVMRDSRGGALNAGYDIGSIARSMGLKTIVSGYCISACSTMFVGGVDRAFADDQPLWRQYIGIHGASIGGQVADDATQQGIYHWFLDMIAGGDPSKTDDNLLQNAFLHMQDSQALAYVYDPASGANPSVYWCNSGSQAYADCLKYPQDDAYSIGLVTEQGHAQTDDTLNVTTSVSGNINPNYYNPWDPANGSYASTSPIPNQPGWVNIYFNDNAFSLADSWGVLRLSGNGHWTLGTDADGNPIRVAADSMWLSDGGRLTLDGGIVNIKDNYVTDGGVVEGSGTFGQLDEWTYLMARSGALIHPTGAGIDLTGEVVLYNGSTLALDVTPGVKDLPGLQIGLNYTTEDGAQMGALLAYPEANLALNVQPGFYRPGDDYALIGLNAETAYLRQSLGGSVPADFFDFLYGGFSRVVRAGTDGKPLGDGYVIDPSQSIFHPFSNSLISYQVIEQGDGVWLHVNDPFASHSLCRGNDCSLGVSLQRMAASQDTKWQPLLAGLEFSTEAQAHAAAKQLRGDGYVTWRTARYHLVQDFGQALDRHLLSADPAAEQGAGLAMASASTGLTGPNVNLTGMLRYVTSPDEGTGNMTDASRQGMWGQVFGTHGRQDASDDTAGLSDDTQGIMLGLDRHLGANVRLGGSLGYAKQSADASGFHGKTHALDARLYVSRSDDSGYLNANLAYTHLVDRATRSVTLPLYQDVGRARFSESVTSFSVEHGLTFHGSHGITWQPILPRVDLTWMPSYNIHETGATAIGLDGSAKRQLTASAAVGLQAWKTFTTAHGMAITPHARLLAGRRFGDHQQMMVSFDSGVGAFEATGPGQGRRYAQTDLGVTAHSGKLSLLADYVGEFSRRRTDQGLALGLRYTW